MVDILPILEGLAYVGFIAGAVFAVMELRDIKKDRRIELQTRMMEQGTTRELMEPLVKIWRTETADPQELEKEISPVSLYMIGENWSIMANLATTGLIRPKDLLEYFDYATFWQKIGPWVMAEREATHSPNMWDDIESLARMQQERRVST